jgi:2'-5' RNA ligase
MPKPIPPPRGEREAPLTDRLFFAVLPDAAARERIGAVVAELRGAHGLQARPVMADRLHVTMAMVGDFAGIPGNLLARASQAAQEAVRVVAPFDVCLDRAQTFTSRLRGAGRRPLVLTCGDGMGEISGVAGLQTLHQALSLALRKAGISGTAGNAPAYTPHLTLMYDEHAVPELPVPAVAWRAAELVLLHSRIGQNIPYAALGRWPLQG